MLENRTAHRERPILFSGPMVRAILDGRKTVTRRVVKPQYIDPNWSVRPAAAPRHERHSHDWWLPDATAPASALPPCPYGQPGDQLWVRETWMDLRGTGVEHRPTPDSPLQRYAYGADSPPGSHSDEARKDFGLKWRPSIHMPREACRLHLEITDVRVERLQDISDDQAKAEGMVYTDFGMQERPGKASIDGGKTFHPLKPQQAPGWHAGDATHPDQCLDRARWAFANLWEKINGENSWDANPWVWVVEFHRINP